MKAKGKVVGIKHKAGKDKATLAVSCSAEEEALTCAGGGGGASHRSRSRVK